MDHHILKRPLKYILLGGAIIIAMALTLHAMGRVGWCTCGTIKLWHGTVASSQNSQHLFDWYSFTHVLHGFLFYLLLWLLDRKNRLSFGAKLVMAIGLAASWEVLENSNTVIERYRAVTVSFGYYGDSILNSIGDILSMMAGFFIAHRARRWMSIALFVAMELFLAYAIRDNLTLNIIMLIHPIDAIRVWQNG
jgi:TRAP-type uncharacterized transport system fused permease subunit